MPKIEVDRSAFYTYLGKTISPGELETVFPLAKAELDGVDEEKNLLKIELNDTNRPDLWSAPGIARQLRVHETGDIPGYSFFSGPDKALGTGERVVTVDPALKEIRPFITAFAVTDKPLDDAGLREIIQIQEKICWNYGQKRRSIAMGVYRSDLIRYPVRYLAADPDKTAFVPLDFTRELTLRQINSIHPKGKDFGHIVSDFSVFPFLTDADGEVLSYPPVINSARIGAVEEGDKNLFIELTGTDIYSLTLATSIIACDLTDMGYTVLPVKIEYPYDTPFGREVVTPYYFQEKISADLGYIKKQLGIGIEAAEAVELLRRMGVSAEAEVNADGKGEAITISPPEYRNDFLHPADIVEDVMISRGMDSFEPEMPKDFTLGRLRPETEFGRKVKDIMVGLGFQEMIYNYLGSKKDFLDNMGLTEDDGEGIIQIANPMTENYEYLRPSILPHLLFSESVSGNAVYPHKIFEVGKIAVPDGDNNYGSVTKNYLGFLHSDNGIDFNAVSSYVSAVMFYLSGKYTLEETEDPRFIPGRTARILYKGRYVGIFGETHPRVLEKWGIQMPVTICEVDLDSILFEGQ